MSQCRHNEEQIAFGVWVGSGHMHPVTFMRFKEGISWSSKDKYDQVSIKAHTGCGSICVGMLIHSLRPYFTMADLCL